MWLQLLLDKIKNVLPLPQNEYAYIKWVQFSFCNVKLAQRRKIIDFLNHYLNQLNKIGTNVFVMKVQKLN